MKTLPATFLAVSLLAASMVARADVVTVTHKQPSGTTEYQVPAGVSAEVASYALNSSQLYLVKDGIEVEIANSGGSVASAAQVLAGPGIIRIKSFSSHAKGLVTLRLAPDAYPPDKTLIIAPSTNQFNITLESSTNLVN